jgi:hypothetical protein
MNATSEFTATNVASFGDTDSLLKIGEVFEIALLDLQTQLNPDLVTSTEFTIEVVPPRTRCTKSGKHDIRSSAGTNV